MPAFREQLQPNEIQLLVDWMRGEWPRPGEGQPTEETPQTSVEGEMSGE
jgi:mono/diheme cytochrome c family protein